MVSYIDLDDGSNIALQGATLDQLSRNDFRFA
jgi:hypothetical protein